MIFPGVYISVIYSDYFKMFCLENETDCAIVAINCITQLEP